MGLIFINLSDITNTVFNQPKQDEKLCQKIKKMLL